MIEACISTHLSDSTNRVAECQAMGLGHAAVCACGEMTLLTSGPTQVNGGLIQSREKDIDSV